MSGLRCGFRLRLRCSRLPREDRDRISAGSQAAGLPRGLGPFAWLVWAALTGNLSANPLSDLTNETGVWTLRVHLHHARDHAAARAHRVERGDPLPPDDRAVRVLLRHAALPHLRHRRSLRRARLHRRDVALATARNLVASVGEDIYKRPFITVGFTAWMTMVPLAMTSTAGMIRRLGGRRWNLLHRLVYVDRRSSASCITGGW